MKKLLVCLGAVAMAAAWSSGAQAVTVSISAGPNSPGGGDITFDSGLVLGTVINTPTFSEILANQAGPQSFVGVSFAGDAYIVNNGDPSGPANGQSATPAGDVTNYMSVLGGTSETLTFSATSKNFGLYWGSIDDYNSITFVRTGFADVTITGAYAPILAGPDFGNQFADPQNRYIVFSDILFDSIVLQSSKNSFEFDNVSFASAGNAPGTPETSTWAMMLLGFLGVGFISYRRKTAKPSLRFA